MALAHFKRIADATDLPLIAFQYPLATGQGYPRDTLLKMVDEVPSIRAIKDWAGNVPQHEMHIRTLQSLPRPVNVLTTHSAWLLSSLVLGCNGLLSGSGSVIPDLQAQLFHAVKANDLAEARRLNDRIYPLARVFYADPWADMHNRMKEALVLLGRLPRAVVRLPLVKLAGAEIDRIRAALVEAGLLSAKAEVFGAAFAGGWAVASYLDLGPYGVHIMQGIFFACGIAVMVEFIRNARRVEPFTTRG
jgi:4-hydroxy-tetrahydrodipicolinate synthase